MNITDKARLLQTSILSSLMLGLGGVAYAQTPDQVPAQVDGFEEEDTIVVTGSRIRRRSIETIFPTNSINSEVLQDRGFTNIADALGEIPSFGGNTTDFGGQNGATVGQNFVNFLNLGSQRTLVLVDGRRFVNSATASLQGANGLQVDFNVIPSALIERVDTIGVGGAAVYGADAIAGTVNVILRDDFEGLEASSQYTVTEQGDADNLNIQLVAGANFDDDKGNVTFSLEYETQEGLSQLDRDSIFAPQQQAFFSEFFDGTAANGFEDQLAIFNGQEINIFTNGGVASPGNVFIGTFGAGAFPVDGLLQFDAAGNLVPFNAGAPIPGQSAFFADGGDGSNLFQEVGQLQTPAERIVGTSRFNYSFSDRLTANAEFLFANTNADELTNQGGFQSFAFQGGSGGALTFSVNHPLLTTQARNTLLANGVDPVTGTFVVNRLNNDIIDSSNDVETSLWRFSGGFEGTFDFAGREFSWDAQFTHGESNLEQNASAINDFAFFNALDAVVLTQADVDAAGGIDSINALSGITVGVGDVVCQSVIDAAIDPDAGVAQGNNVSANNNPFVQGCAPLDVFGVNRGSTAALDFVTGPSTITADNTSQQFVANLTGSLFDLPAGPLAFNIGYERRLESGAFQPSLANQIGLGRAAAVSENAGSFRTQEFYGELSVPIVSPDLDIPFVRELSAEGAYRTIEVSTLANDTEAFTVGGKYSPIEDITFVGNYTESTRLPSIAELFTPLAGTFSGAGDPCDPRNLNQAADVALRTANCASVGLPDLFSTNLGSSTGTGLSNIVNATALGANGGNPNLIPETAEAFTVGVILEPRFIPDLSVKLDYIQVNIDDAIQGVSLTQNLNACFDSPNFPNVPQCNTFTRDAGGQIVDFVIGQANAATFETQFLQAQASYFYDVSDAFNYFGGLLGNSSTSSDWGSVSHNLTVFSPLQRDNAVGDEDPALNNIRGGFADPNVSLNFATNYTKDNLRVFWGVLWQDNPLVTTNPLNTDEFFNVFTPNAADPVAGVDADGRLNPANAITKGDGGQFINNASISYNLEDVIGSSDTILQFGVNNVFDRQPSLLENALGDFNAAQIFGRTYRLSIRSRF